MKKRLLSIVVILIPLIASAYDKEIGGIYYNLDNTNKTATVTYGSYRNLKYNSSGYDGKNLVIPSKVTLGNVSYTVTAIGTHAFENSKVLSVSIPEEVVLIGESAFRNCNFVKEVNIPSGITKLYDNTFYFCKQLSSITIPESVTEIGKYAFAYTALTSIDIPNRLTTISYCMFSGCESLSSVNIPNSVTTIEAEAFNNCKSLESIVVPNSVTSIGKSAFAFCSSLVSFDIPNSVTTISEFMFDGCTKLSNINIPNSVTTIERYAFQECKSLSSIDIPNSVTSIGYSAFNGTGLISVSFPNSIKEIETGVLGNCSMLRTVFLPSSVINIADYAFYACYNMTSFTYLNPTPPAIGPYTFTSYTATLYVPVGSKTAYQNAEYWKNFTNIVEGDPSGIEEVMKDAVNENAPLYNLNGYRLKEPQRGINIVGGKKVIVR